MIRPPLNFWQNKTNQALYQRFSPVINNSLQKVGATKVWTDIITRYNNIPLTKDVNPDLTDYVTQEALEGVYTMISVEEKEIRNNINARTTDVLRRVFALKTTRKMLLIQISLTPLTALLERSFFYFQLFFNINTIN